jgi:WD40 repeat protein
MSDAFLSYSRRDTEQASALKNYLKEQASLDVWMDTADLHAGVIWRDELKRAVEAALSLIVLVTPDALISEYVADEINYGVQCGKPIIPVVLGLPEEALREDAAGGDGPRPIDFSRLPRWLRVFQIVDARARELNAPWEEVAAAVRRDYESNRLHASLLVRAHRWSQGAGSLLSGRDLAEAAEWQARSSQSSPDSRRARPTDLHRSYVQASREDERRRAADSSRRLADLVLSGLDEPDLGLRLAIANVETHGPTPSGVLALDHELRGSRSLGPLGPAGPLIHLRFLDPGDRVLLIHKLSTILPASEVTIVSTSGELVVDTFPIGFGQVLASDRAGKVAILDGKRLRIVDAVAQEDRIIDVWTAGGFPYGAFDGSGRTLLTAGDRGGAWIWDVKAGRPIVELLPEEAVRKGASKSQREPTVEKSGQLRDRRSEVTEVTAVALSADGRLAAVARYYPFDDRNEIEVHEAESGNVVCSASVEWGVHALEIDPRGAFCVSLSESRENSWGEAFQLPLDGKPPLRIASRVMKLALSRDGAFLAVVDVGGLVRVVDVATWSEVAVVGRHDPDIWIAPSFSPEGNQLLTGTVEEHARLWQLEDESGSKPRDVRECPMPAQVVRDRGDRPVTFLAFSPDGSRLCATGAPLIGGIWKLERNEAPRALYPTPYKGRVCWLPDGSLLGISYLDPKCILRFAADTWQESELMNVRSTDERSYRSLAVSRDGRRLATIGPWPYDHIEVHDLEGLKLRFSLQGSPMGAFYWKEPFILSNDGALVLAANTDCGYEVWDVERKEPAVERPSLGAAIHATAFSPKGNRFAVAIGARVFLRGVRDDGCEVPLVGSRGRVNSIAFFAEGDRVVTGSDDGTARVWDAASGEELRRLEVRNAFVTTVDASPDSRLVATGSSDGLIRIWELWSTEQMLELAKRSGRELSEDEQRHFGLHRS